MIDELQAFAEWLQGLPPLGIYAVVLLVSYGENVIPPLPGDALVVLAGSLVGLGVVAAGPVVALSAAGSVLGFMTMFWIGRRLGAAVEDPRRVRWLPRGPIHTVERWLQRWGYGVVALNRFLSGGRAVIALMAGASELRPGPTALWATASAVVWTALLVAGGHALGREWPRLLGLLRIYGRIVTAALLVLAAAWIGWRLWRRWSAERNREDPPGGEAGGSRPLTPHREAE